MNTILTQIDKAQLQQQHYDEQTVLQQLRVFKEGIPPVQLVSAAVPQNGILQLSLPEQQRFIKGYHHQKKQQEIIKFIPASGAATRMFKPILAFLRALEQQPVTAEALIEQPEHALVKKVWEQREKLAFYADITSGHTQAITRFFKHLLQELKLDDLPKGLIPFHRYGNRTLTPFEEHLHEAVTYAENQQKIRVHFTVSPAHLSLFQSQQEHVESQLKANGYSVNIDYSFQDPATDTLAVNLDNTPFRNANGELIFRPGGHGALVQNLNQLTADLVFIKNVDNVVKQAFLSEHAYYKKLLGGILLELQSRFFEWLSKIEAATFTEKDLSAVNEVLAQYFFQTEALTRMDEVKNYLNRPLRVCGMVENQGAPGGGPYWVKHSKTGKISLQIVESAQIDKSNPQQAQILQDATHFNPVDLVCGIKDFKGNQFDLSAFVDADAGFITHKSLEGKPLKALELPGLWNGGMAYWNTVFVEVPACTFNPVKTVADLLNPSHTS